MFLLCALSGPGREGARKARPTSGAGRGCGQHLSLVHHTTANLTPQPTLISYSGAAASPWAAGSDWAGRPGTGAGTGGTAGTGGSIAGSTGLGTAAAGSDGRGIG